MSDKQNLKEQFINIMKKKILSGEYQPNDRIPSERTLASELGISRGSVNQGMLDLERMGFVKIVPRQGAFVNEFMKKATPEIISTIMKYDTGYFDQKIFQNLMDLRILIEKECVKLACENMNDSSQIYLNKLFNQMIEANQDIIVQKVYAYHKGLTEISGNAAYTMVFESFKKMIISLIRQHYTDKTKLKKIIPHYQKLTSSIINQNLDTAMDELLFILSSAGKFIEKELGEIQSHH